jgi:hypothetical protein
MNLHALVRQEKPESRRNAGFFQMLLLSACSLQADNVAREGKALTAFRLATHTGIDVAWPFMATACRFTQFLFPNGVADTDYHRFDL